jgi:hypothetical protein
MIVNGIEFEMLTAVADILQEGNPETQIAKRLAGKGWSTQMVIDFLCKIKLSPEWDEKILNAYLNLFDETKESYEKFDEAQHLGDSLKRTAFYAERAKTYV